MNFRFVFNQMGLLLLVLAGFLLAVAGWSFAQTWWREVTAADLAASWGLLIAAGVCGTLGGVVAAATRRRPSTLGRREALLLVALSWLIGAAVSGLPFFAWAQLHFPADAPHSFSSFVNCYFEAMSGLTTTGATILSEIEDIPRSLLLWRALTHWLGGLGIVVLFVAVLPSLGAGGKKLFRVEAPGPSHGGVRPHIRDTARVLWFIYLGLTLLEILALRVAGGMTWFDSVCHTMATLATGGFSTMNASIGHYNALAIDIIIVVFMILAGANFELYYQLLRGRWRQVYQDVELRAYLATLLVGSVIVVCALWNSADAITMTDGTAVASGLGESARQGVFTTVSIQTTTGFCTSDFNQWPFVAKSVLVLLMFVGGCAGSTAGGVKVIRLWIAFKVMLAELERAFRPNVIRPVRVAGATIDSEMKLGVIAYVLGAIVVIILGSVVIMTLEQANPASACDFTTASTASIATLCTIGPGLARVGAVENYGWFTDGSKAVMALLMALGRLEFFAILLLFSPRFWRGD